MYLAKAILHLTYNTKIETSTSHAQIAPHNSPSQLSLGAQFKGRTPNNADVEMASCMRSKFIQNNIISASNIRHYI